MPPVLHRPGCRTCCSRIDLQAAVIIHSDERAYPQFFNHSFDISETSTQFEFVPFRPRFVPILPILLSRNIPENTHIFFPSVFASVTPRKFVKFEQKLSQERFRPSHHGTRREGKRRGGKGRYA